ncbi:hypothetical protein [Secundilactobacillus silagei]|uniref:Uncharacterized protein n=1 Tax=Secundilactobacillus silagei JCM 19001 TaxID=1302250 RepID=A0A1Z5IHI8_9LACO|nr:hypothetical protein [Secundilactobacillus silagei]TDG69289.1 hypothetical protein C5L25_000220 [Secundilactobacillus silagei JCM 19001]GAX01012.1 hypothetical protein IWT126_01035 [Secundilactobacillus silagei JCM 19001]
MFDELPDLLIKERPLLVLPSLAMKIGVSQAMLLQTLSTLTQTQGETIDDESWLRISNQELHTWLPFWNLSTVRDNLDKLEARKYLMITHFGNGHYDPTNWYHINTDGLNGILLADEMED